MFIYRPTASLSTHEVKNQATPLNKFSLWSHDLSLMEATKQWGASHSQNLKSFANSVGSEESILWGEQANQYPPELCTFDRYGHRIDQVKFHPAYHNLMQLGIEAGITNIAWNAEQEGHFAHASLLYMLSQVEAGVCCPMSMTYAGFPVLQHHGNMSDFTQKLKAPQYDDRMIPYAQKTGLTLGMAMTEKQGGSDVRMNQTIATPNADGSYSLTGHKWFCSAPMSDGFLTLAQSPEGLSCFFVPRWTADEQRNGIHIQRLKNKLGNHSNASSEIEYNKAWAQLVGRPGKGVKTIIEMVHHTRLDASLANTSLMRQALVQATHHCVGRQAFGKRLIDQPLMRQVLADLCIESEAATWMSLRVAHAFDQQNNQEYHGMSETLFARIATAVSKYWICKRTPPHVYEALECHGGAGYVEESIMPRLYREAPLNSIWEGSGNVICLDILRALNRSPETAEALLNEIELARGYHKQLDQHMDHVKSSISQVVSQGLAESQARTLGADLALALQGSLLARYAPHAVSDAFCITRIEKSARVYGDLPTGVDIDGVLKQLEPIIQGAERLQ
jgi:putative acyl-CoA dehydrogenase